ncbi:MAG: histidinol-phosphate transaminase [Chloroflexota bacterium]
MRLRPEPEIMGLAPGTHGGINPAELKAAGVRPEDVLDFSVSSNPYMPPPGIRRVLAAADISRYPDSLVGALRERLAGMLAVSPESIIVGSGTTEIIRLIAQAYFRQGQRALLLAPTYGEYDIACRIAGVQLTEHRLRAENDFRLLPEEAAELIPRYRPEVMFLCNPNNPTGQYLGREKVEALLAGLGDGLLVLDEAYIAFVEDAWNSLDLAARGNVIILRSMTKDWGMCGLRLGYAVATPPVIDVLRRVCPPWNVNIAAQEAGAAALAWTDYLTASLRKVRRGRDYLVRELTRMGYRVLPTEANYFLVEVGDAAAFRAKLLPQGILVRDCTSFGLPEYVRLAPRTLPECRRLVHTVAALSHG